MPVIFQPHDAVLELYWFKFAWAIAKLESEAGVLSELRRKPFRRFKSIVGLLPKTFASSSYTVHPACVCFDELSDRTEGARSRLTRFSSVRSLTFADGHALRHALFEETAENKDIAFWTQYEQLQGKIDDLRQELNHWSNGFSLNASCFIELAFVTLWHWQFNKKAEWNYEFWRHGLGDNTHFVPEPRGFHPDIWNFSFQSDEQYEEESVAAFKRHIRKYLDQQIAELKARGYRLYRRPLDYSQLQWLVRWNCQRWSKKDIAHTYNTSVRTVENTFQKFKRLGLPVREGERGRPQSHD